ncbi:MULTISPECIES: hypothetical protein [Actinoplanes]|uniref:hypothetical protein n=1 Tax=Actinoplanes TaxID=1865 RepID=UPI0005F29978|nr:MULTISPECIES: hypothetical protein [Actinoplanes]GLY07736.1 hypothetical protein Acsp01_81150 [Actinoplanes sp. NBRC 101535]
MTTHEASVTEVPASTAGPRLEILAGQCGSGTCPTVYRAGPERVVVQGYTVTAEDVGVEVPEGERLVEIPVDVLLAAADRVRQNGGGPTP